MARGFFSLYNLGMKISTKKGDEGESELRGGQRLSKGDCAFDFLGTMDELQSWIGLARVACGSGLGGRLRILQEELYVMMGGGEGGDVGRLEEWGRAYGDVGAGFVVPGDKGEASARLHVARTVCRRCEREAVRAGCKSEVLRYLNRLSDFLFMAAEDF